MKGFDRLLLLAGVSAAFSAASLAQSIPSDVLKDANSGEFSVEQLLANYGFKADLASAQLEERIFQQNSKANSYTFEALWSEAGLAGKHRVGIYDPADPFKIEWILGNVSSDGTQVTSWTGDISGPFGLALDNGIGDTFYSEAGLNSDSVISSSNPILDGFDQRQHVVALQNEVDPNEVIFSWEDLQNPGEIATGGYLDYNDFGMTMRSANPVPEPGTMLALGLGAAAFAARKRKKKA